MRESEENRISGGGCRGEGGGDEDAGNRPNQGSGVRFMLLALTSVELIDPHPLN